MIPSNGCCMIVLLARRGTHKDCLPQRRPMARDGLAAMTILILGGDDDDHAVFMRDFLRQRGADAEMLDSRWFPQSLRLGFDPVADTWSIALPGGRHLDGRAVQAVYWRCYNGIATPALPDAEQAYIAANDARGLFESFLIALPARWVNGFRAYRLHQTKPVQLAMVARLGLDVPATVLTNDPERVRDFAARHPRCIFKPVQ